MPCLATSEIGYYKFCGSPHSLETLFPPDNRGLTLTREGLTNLCDFELIAPEILE